MKKYFVILLSNFAMGGVRAQEVITPTVVSPTSFVVIVDETTFREARTEILDYKKSVEADGLGTFIMARNWSSPEEIRTELRTLYQNKKSPIEGAVFIGNIPVPMIREAQYLTSTFKMSETLRWDRSSVPSDRFYDDFDLEFEFLKQDEDSTRRNLFYYKIKPGSPQYIEMDIYTGRIKPPYKSGSAESVEQIKKYLKKIVALKSEKNRLDQMVVSTAHGYNSNSTVSWGSETAALRTSFPALFRPGGSMKFINYRTADFMKNILLTELRREDLDFAFMTGHGTATLQLINGYPDASSPQPSMENVGRYIRSKMRAAGESGRDLEKVKEGFQTSLGLNEKWFEDAFSDERILQDSIFNDNLDIHTRDLSMVNARVAYLNSCLTGSFHRDDYLAGYYPFSEGKNVLAFANSVGVLQDLYSIQLLGILQHGVRAGFLLKKTAFLETHIFGDPTYHFTSPKNYNRLFADRKASTADWGRLLRLEDPDLQAYALTELAKRKPERTFSQELLTLMKTSPYESVRTQAYFILRSFHNEYFLEALALAIVDNYEYLRRKATYDIAEAGDDSLIPMAVKAYLENQESKRIVYRLDWVFQLLSQNKALEELEVQLKENPAYAVNEPLSQRLKKKLEYENGKTLRQEKTLLDTGIAVKTLKSELRTLRAYRYHRLVPAVISIASDESRPDELRIAALETLSWFGMSYRRADIEAVCSRIIGKNVPGQLLDEAKKTVRVLEDTAKRPF